MKAYYQNAGSTSRVGQQRNNGQQPRFTPTPPQLQPHPNLYDHSFAPNNNYQHTPIGMHFSTPTYGRDGMNYISPSEHTPIGDEAVDNKEEKVRLQRLVSQVLYREIKFICDQGELDAYHEQNTIGCFVMSKLNVPDEQRATYWSAYKDHVNKSINALRCANANAIKSAWKGKNVNSTSSLRVISHLL